MIIERNTAVETAHGHSFMTNSHILETLSKADFTLNRTETFLPRDTIYVYQTVTETHEATHATRTRS